MKWRESKKWTLEVEDSCWMIYKEDRGYRLWCNFAGTLGYFTKLKNAKFVAELIEEG